MHVAGRLPTPSKLSGNVRLQSRQREVVATLLDQFVLMYEHHAAREGTVVFPAWKKTLSTAQLHDMNEKCYAILDLGRFDLKRALPVVSWFGNHERQHAVI